MSADAKAIALVVVILILTTGCAGATPRPGPLLPSATSIPPTATAAAPTGIPSPTKAPIQPTVTPELAAPDESALNITYTCNDGFIIAFHGKKVLVDALFREPGIPCYTDPEAVATMTRAEPPFDGVDLILISHAHSDHFDPQIVGTFLQNNPQAALVSMGSVIDELKKRFSGFAQVKDRAHGVQLAEKESAQMTVHGIDLEIINAPADVPNLGFLIQIGGVTLFHAGDSGSNREMVDLFQSYHLPDKQIDLAFVPWQYLGDEWYRPLVDKGIQAKNYVPMHFVGDDAKMLQAVPTSYPQAVLFRKTMQTFVYSPPAPPTATPVPTLASKSTSTPFSTPPPVSLHVLFIGNSHIFTNNLPEMFANLAQSGNHPVHADASAIGGYTLEQHTTDSRTLKKIAGARWDYVILQESTAMSPAEIGWSQRLIPAARTLDKKIKDARAQTILFMTWASASTYAKGGLDGFADEQAQAATQFLALARELDAPLAPVGLAWENALRARPELKLWQSDQVHATRAGTYLMACVLYAVVFQQSPDSLSYTADLPEDTARFLQRIAMETVLPQATHVPPTATAAALTSTPPQMPPGQPVSFTAEDGVKLAGTLFPAKGETAVVLAHMGIADQKSWQSFAGHISGRGHTALTFDFRCYGLSECGKLGKNESLHTLDIRAAIRFLRARGLKRIACMGASMGGTACMNAALDEELAGMVVIASPAPLYMGKQYPDDLVNPAMKKLFIVAEKDRYAQVVPAIYSLYDQSPGPKKLGIFPGTVHGTELFATKSGAEFRDLLTRFMEELATPVAKPTSTPSPTQGPTTSRAPGQVLYKTNFESGISQWQQRVGILNHTTSEYHTAPGAAKMTTAKPDGFGGYSGTSGHCIDLGSELGIRPGASSQKDVTFELYLKSDESIMAANLGVYFHTAPGCKGTFTTDTSPAGVGRGQDWTLVSTAGAVPDTTQSIDIVVHAMGMNNSAAVYIDDVQVYLSSPNPAKP